MSDNTGIEWTDATWNPVSGCTKVSTGCDHCYAETLANRFAGTKAFPNGFEVTLRPERLDWPLRKRKPLRIFVNSMSDLFHDSVPDEYIARVWQAMGCAPHHTYQILTKRHARMRSWVTRWYSGEMPEPYEIREVPGYPGYRISTHGEVFGKRSDTAGGLSFDIGEQGHRRVTMHRSGSPRSGDRELVHRLMLTTFVRPARKGEQACHRNGDPSDNRLSNLYWGTQSDNWRDRISHGNGRSWSKLTDADVAVIRRRAEAGESAYRIAQDYPVSDTQIRNVLRGDQWVTPRDVPRVQPPARALLDCVWLGVSAENQQWADIRVPALLDTPAAVRFISAEPLLGPIDLLGNGYLAYDEFDRSGVDWVITGGESGPGARPAHPQWFRSLRDQCQAAGVAFLHKQHGEWIEDVTEYPANPECGIDEPYRVLNVPRDAKDWKRCALHLCGSTALTPDNPFNPFTAGHGGWTAMRRVGKKRAGRLLDGRTWDEFPREVSQ